MAVELHLIAKGRVQRVFFRANTQKLARELNLVGWVKNLPTGDVELIAQGEKATLEALISGLKAEYPTATFHPTYRSPSTSFDSFTIIR